MKRRVNESNPLWRIESDKSEAIAAACGQPNCPNDAPGNEGEDQHIGKPGATLPSFQRIFMVAKNLPPIVSSGARVADVRKRSLK